MWKKCSQYYDALWRRQALKLNLMSDTSAVFYTPKFVRGYLIYGLSLHLSTPALCPAGWPVWAPWALLLVGFHEWKVIGWREENEVILSSPNSLPAGWSLLGWVFPPQLSVPADSGNCLYLFMLLSTLEFLTIFSTSCPYPCKWPWSISSDLSYGCQLVCGIVRHSWCCCLMYIASFL